MTASSSTSPRIPHIYFSLLRTRDTFVRSINERPALIPRNKSSLINQHSSIISSFHNLVRTGHAPHRAMMKKPPGFRILLKEPSVLSCPQDPSHSDVISSVEGNHEARTGSQKPKEERIGAKISTALSKVSKVRCEGLAIKQVGVSCSAHSVFITSFHGEIHNECLGGTSLIWLQEVAFRVRCDT
uniref:Uncharacterized protein n=1 Tax=Cucumis melo TaxID=3656 RepID=A0A9I9EML7_CUCME